MNCSICHHEFGNGEKCQNCGADRVVGLGNLNAYVAGSVNSGEFFVNNTSNETKTVVSFNTICYKCGQVIPTTAKFCPYCRTELFAVCPSCGSKYTSQFPNCPNCGTNAKEFQLEQQRKKDEEEKKKKAKLERNNSKRVKTVIRSGFDIVQQNGVTWVENNGVAISDKYQSIELLFNNTKVTSVS